jgi:DNA repair protein RecN (Recombination protein N)
MLKELRIRNLAIIDDLTVRFGEGLNVLTGETGAGKSIIVDSLGLALGSRAQSDLVRSGEKEAVVEAYFEIEEKKGFPDIGVDMSEGLILRRTLSAAGKSRAYINDTMVSQQTIAEFGKSLVDIHGQHEHQSLFSVDKHRDFLDAFGKFQGEQEGLEALYMDVEALKRQITDLGQKAKEREQRLDLLRFQVHEIDAASLRIGEKEKLSEQRAILSNLGRLNELAETAYSALYGAEGSCMERLSSIISKVKEMSSIDHSVSPVLNMLESAFPSIEDAAVSLRGYRDKYDFEPERLSGVEDRLDLLRKLEKKYGEGIENIIGYRDDAERELKGLEHIDERLDALEADLNAKEVMLLNAAGSLSDKRKNAAQKMEALIRTELKDLAFSNAEFMIDIKKEAISAHGMDRVEFLFSANPGEPPKPLLKIASGGELSRVMLALKSILADFDSIPVLIFDEVDAGIGGKTAERVGKKLKAIANKHQVLCTTHLPQIASMGDYHLKTEKGQRGERVYVEVKELTGNERLNEIARMLSGKITEVSLKHAKELIESNV